MFTPQNQVEKDGNDSEQGKNMSQQSRSSKERAIINQIQS